ncbi:MAG: hypothetical protein WCG25_04155 [bacterium]
MVSIIKGHISQIRSIASICTGFIAIGIFRSALAHRLISIANNSQPLEVIQANVVFFRF